jgi:PKD repeat protein
MSAATAPAPAAPAKKGFGLFKAALGGGLGLATGVIGVYATAIVDKVAKPAKPVANFAVSVDGLTVTAQNRASGESGWWDFGDGSPLEPFDPNQPEVPHAYVKPGSYAVKLTVRNFLNEENERTVPVDVAVPAAGTAGGPTITGLTVEPVGNGTAPATFRVRGELKNAQHLIFDSGLATGGGEVLTAAGAFEKYVVYERPGPYPLTLYAVSGTKLDKQWKLVEVAPPAAGALGVVAKVTDTGFRAERKTGTRLEPVPVPAKPTGGFERVIPADPGCTLAEAKLLKYESKAVKNLKVAVAADGKSAKLTGDWTGAAGGEPLVPVQLVQDKQVPLPGVAQPVAAQLVAPSIFDSFDSVKTNDWNSGVRTATLTLPPPPAGATARRSVALQVVEADARGKGVPLVSVPDLTKPADEVTVTLSNKQRQVVRWERLANGQVKVTARPVPAGR